MPIIISGSNGISGVDGTAAAPAVQGADNNTGMFFPAADTIAFSEGGTEALRLNASGNAVFAGTVQTAGITTSLYPLVQGTAVASTSGTSIDFTGIPSWVRRVTVMFNGVSTNGTALVQIQLGSSTGFVTSGYAGGATYSTSNGTNSTGLLLDYTGGPTAAVVRTGAVSIANITGNTWVSFGSISWNANTTVNSGSVALSGVLDRVRITTVGGTDTFDAGSVNILWE